MNLNYVTAENISSFFLSEKKIAVYGAGDYGYYTGKFLQKYGCANFFYCVDDEYVVRGQSFHGRPVLSLNEAADKADAIFFAVGQIGKLQKFQESSLVKDVYVVFDPYEFWKYNQAFMDEHRQDFIEAKELFADELSRRTLDGYLLAKKTGDISLDLTNVVPDVYFNELTKKLSSGAYVDCGTFDGGMIDKYLAWSGRSEEKIFAFEPDKKNFALLKEKYQSNKNITVSSKGVYSETTALYFKASGHENREATLSYTGDIAVEVVKLDDVLFDEKTAFIKITVNGSDFEALCGARRIIERDRPVLAVTVFAKPEYLFTVPKYLSSFGFYKIYLRHHEAVSGRIVVYAVAQ